MTLVLPRNGHFLAHMLNLDPLLVSHQSPHRCYLTVYKYFRIQLSTHALATIIPFRALLWVLVTHRHPHCVPVLLEMMWASGPVWHPFHQNIPSSPCYCH